MALHYADASALIKRYLPETGSQWIRNRLTVDTAAFSQLAIGEVASALARRTREGVLTSEQREQVFTAFLNNLDSYTVMPVTEELILEACGLLLSIPGPLTLRASDALHIASALAAFERARRERIETGRFITADTGLAAAAEWAGLPVANPEEDV